MHKGIVRMPSESDGEIGPRFFGLTKADIHECLRRGYIAGAFCTDNHPNGSEGYEIWKESNAGLRERGRQLGWDRSNEDNIPTAVSPDLSIAVTVVTGDGETGNPFRSPRTKNPRKTASCRLIVQNRQLNLLLFGDEPVPRAANLEDTHQRLWYVLHVRYGDIVRIELSQPDAVDDEGQVVSWSERLIIDSLDLSDIRLGNDDDGQADVDVPVQRRG